MPSIIQANKDINDMYKLFVSISMFLYRSYAMPDEELAKLRYLLRRCKKASEMIEDNDNLNGALDILIGDLNEFYNNDTPYDVEEFLQENAEWIHN